MSIYTQPVIFRVRPSVVMALQTFGLCPMKDNGLCNASASIKDTFSRDDWRHLLTGQLSLAQRIGCRVIDLFFLNWHRISVVRNMLIIFSRTRTRTLAHSAGYIWYRNLKIA